MRTKTLFALLCFGLLSLPAHADISSGNIFGISYSKQISSGEGEKIIVPNSLQEMDTFTFRYGRFFTSYLGVEAHLGFSLETKDEDRSLKNKTDYLGAVFARFNLPFHSQNINLYALGGAGMARVSLSGPESIVAGEVIGGKVSETLWGPAFGVGIALYASNKTALNIEWIRYVTDEGQSSGDASYTMDGISVGIVHHFSFPKVTF